VQEYIYIITGNLQRNDIYNKRRTNFVKQFWVSWHTHKSTEVGFMN